MEKLKELIQKYKHAWILVYALIYIRWFSYLEKTITVHTGYHVMHARLDDLIPFNEYFVIPYFIWFGYVAVTVLYLMIHNKDDYYRLCAFLFTGMTISLIICSIFPNGTDFRPQVDPDKNLCSYLVYHLYQTDTCTNVFPSIHCYNSIGCHIAIMQSREIERSKHGRLIRWSSFVLCLLICMATMFLKQHSVLDVCGAVLMAMVMYGVVYGYPAMAPAGDRRKAPELFHQER